MPDWKFFRDREGNTYYYDRAMKLRITDDKPFDYIPVSAEGNDYYLHKGIELVKAGKYAEGLYYLKSLKALPAENFRVQNNSKDAAKWINNLRKKHGTRYDRFDSESTVLLTYYGEKYSIINEKLRYKIVLKKRPAIVKAYWKQTVHGYGLKFGFNLDKSSPDRQGYDCITGIESRVLKGETGNIADAENFWRREFGRDNFVREEVFRREDRVIYLYRYGDDVPVSGIEGIYINGNIIHVLRVLCSSGIKDRIFDEILKPVEEMVLVN